MEIRVLKAQLLGEMKGEVEEKIGGCDGDGKIVDQLAPSELLKRLGSEYWGRGGKKGEVDDSSEISAQKETFTPRLAPSTPKVATSAQKVYSSYKPITSDLPALSEEYLSTGMVDKRRVIILVDEALMMGDKGKPVMSKSACEHALGTVVGGLDRESLEEVVVCQFGRGGVDAANAGNKTSDAIKQVLKVLEREKTNIGAEGRRKQRPVKLREVEDNASSNTNSPSPSSNSSLRSGIDWLSEYIQETTKKTLKGYEIALQECAEEFLAEKRKDATEKRRTKERASGTGEDGSKASAGAQAAEIGAEYSEIQLELDRCDRCNPYVQRWIAECLDDFRNRLKFDVVLFSGFEYTDLLAPGEIHVDDGVGNGIGKKKGGTVDMRLVWPNDAKTATNTAHLDRDRLERDRFHQSVCVFDRTLKSSQLSNSHVTFRPLIVHRPKTTIVMSATGNGAENRDFRDYREHPLHPLFRSLQKEANDDYLSRKCSLACYLGNNLGGSTGGGSDVGGDIDGSSSAGSVGSKLYHLFETSEPSTQDNNQDNRTSGDSATSPSKATTTLKESFPETVRSLINDLNQGTGSDTSSAFAFHSLIIPREEIKHGSGFVTDLLEKPKFYAGNSCSVFYAAGAEAGGNKSVGKVKAKSNSGVNEIPHGVPRDLLINGLRCRVRVFDDEGREIAVSKASKRSKAAAKRNTAVMRKSRAVKSPNPLCAHFMSYISHLAYKLKLAVICNKDDRLTSWLKPLKSLDRIEVSRSLLKVWIAMLTVGIQRIELGRMLWGGPDKPALNTRGRNLIMNGGGEGEVGGETKEVERLEDVGEDVDDDGGKAEDGEVKETAGEENAELPEDSEDSESEFLVISSDDGDGGDDTGGGSGNESGGSDSFVEVTDDENDAKGGDDWSDEEGKQEENEGENKEPTISIPTSPKTSKTKSNRTKTLIHRSKSQLASAKKFRENLASIKRWKRQAYALQECLNDVKDVFLIKTCPTDEWCRSVKDMTHGSRAYLLSRRQRAAAIAGPSNNEGGSTGNEVGTSNAADKAVGADADSSKKPVIQVGDTKSLLQYNAGKSNNAGAGVGLGSWAIRLVPTNNISIAVRVQPGTSSSQNSPSVNTTGLDFTSSIFTVFLNFVGNYNAVVKRSGSDSYVDGSYVLLPETVRQKKIKLARELCENLAACYGRVEQEFGAGCFDSGNMTMSSLSPGEFLLATGVKELREILLAKNAGGGELGELAGSGAGSGLFFAGHTIASGSSSKSINPEDCLKLLARLGLANLASDPQEAQDSEVLADTTATSPINTPPSIYGTRSSVSRLSDFQHYLHSKLYKESLAVEEKRKISKQREQLLKSLLKSTTNPGKSYLLTRDGNSAVAKANQFYGGTDERYKDGGNQSSSLESAESEATFWSDAAMTCGILGLMIDVRRTEAAVIDPWMVKIGRVGQSWADTASGLCSAATKKKMTDDEMDADFEGTVAKEGSVDRNSTEMSDVCVLLRPMSQSQTNNRGTNADTNSNATNAKTDANSNSLLPLILPPLTALRDFCINRIRTHFLRSRIYKTYLASVFTRNTQISLGSQTLALTTVVWVKLAEDLLLLTKKKSKSWFSKTWYNFRSCCTSLRELSRKVKPSNTGEREVLFWIRTMRESLVENGSFDISVFSEKSGVNSLCMALLALCFGGGGGRLGSSGRSSLTWDSLNFRNIAFLLLAESISRAARGYVRHQLRINMEKAGSGNAGGGTAGTADTAGAADQDLKPLDNPLAEEGTARILLQKTLLVNRTRLVRYERKMQKEWRGKFGATFAVQEGTHPGDELEEALAPTLPEHDLFVGKALDRTKTTILVENQIEKQTKPNQMRNENSKSNAMSGDVGDGVFSFGESEKVFAVDHKSGMRESSKFFLTPGITNCSPQGLVAVFLLHFDGVALDAEDGGGGENNVRERFLSGDLSMRRFLELLLGGGGDGNANGNADGDGNAGLRVEEVKVDVKADATAKKDNEKHEGDWQLLVKESEEEKAAGKATETAEAESKLDDEARKLMRQKLQVALYLQGICYRNASLRAANMGKISCCGKKDSESDRNPNAANNSNTTNTSSAVSVSTPLVPWLRSPDLMLKKIAYEEFRRQQIYLQARFTKKLMLELKSKNDMEKAKRQKMEQMLFLQNEHSMGMRLFTEGEVNDINQKRKKEWEEWKEKGCPEIVEGGEAGEGGGDTHASQSGGGGNFKFDPSGPDLLELNPETGLLLYHCCCPSCPDYLRDLRTKGDKRAAALSPHGHKAVSTNAPVKGFATRTSHLRRRGLQKHLKRYLVPKGSEWWVAGFHRTLMRRCDVSRWVARVFKEGFVGNSSGSKPKTNLGATANTVTVRIERTNGGGDNHGADVVAESDSKVQGSAWSATVVSNASNVAGATSNPNGNANIFLILRLYHYADVEIAKTALSALDLTPEETEITRQQFDALSGYKQVMFLRGDTVIQKVENTVHQNDGQQQMNLPNLQTLKTCVLSALEEAYVRECLSLKEYAEKSCVKQNPHQAILQFRSVFREQNWVVTRSR